MSSAHFLAEFRVFPDPPKEAEGTAPGAAARASWMPDRPNDTWHTVHSTDQHPVTPLHVWMSLSGVIGRSRTRTPIASNTAFATAAATPVAPSSPIPLAPSGPEFASNSSTNATSMPGGMSAFTGMGTPARSFASQRPSVGSSGWPPWQPFPIPRQCHQSFVIGTSWS